MAAVSPRNAQPATPRAAREGGYNLVVLIMAITVLNILLAASLPLWSDLIKHDKEEELISRGWQYAEAIRVFQARFQRLPVSLEELIKVKPRCIRQLWKDPMTEDGNWDLIFLNQGTRIRVPGQQPGSGPGGGAPEQPGVPGGRAVPGGKIPRDDNEVPATGPIIGVRSRSDKESSLVFFGHEHYDEWEFRADMLRGGSLSAAMNPAGPLVRPGGPGGARGGPLILSTRWLGRPFPSYIPAGNLRPGGLPFGPTPPGSKSGGGAKPPGGGF